MRAAWILIAGFAALWFTLGWRTKDQARSHDFLSFYTGAWMTAHGDVAHLYDPNAQLLVQRQWAAPGAPLVPFIRPPFYALLLAPLAWLPFSAAFVIWVLTQTAVLLACCYWAWRTFGVQALVFAAMSMPAALGIAHGQDVALFLAVLIGSYGLAIRGADFAAGAVLGLLLIKFHLAPLWPLALLIHQRWKMLAGFAATGAIAALVSLAMIGIDGIRTYATLLQNPDLQWLSPSPEFMISIEGLTANLGIPLLPLLLLVLATFLLAIWRAPLWRLYAAITTASLLLVPHVYGYDAAMLLLGLWLAVLHTARRFTKAAALWLFTPFPFSFTLLGKPWAAVGSLSLLVLLSALSAEKAHDSRSDAPTH